jgi:hypothetical protein
MGLKSLYEIKQFSPPQSLPKRFSKLTVSERYYDKRSKVSHLQWIFKIEKRFKSLHFGADIVLVVIIQGGRVFIYAFEYIVNSIISINLSANDFKLMWILTRFPTIFRC